MTKFVKLGIVTVALVLSSCGPGVYTPPAKSRNIKVKAPETVAAQAMDEVTYPLQQANAELNDGDLYGVPVVVNGKLNSQVLYFDSTVGEFGAFRPTGEFVLTSSDGEVVLTPMSVLDEMVNLQASE